MNRSTCQRIAHALVPVAALILTSCGNHESGFVQGYVEGEYVYLSSPLSGKLDSLLVSRGDRVEKGKLLFALENTKEKAQQIEAKNRLEQARANLEDAKKGRRPSEIAALEAELNRARASLDFAQLELERQDQLRKGGVATQEEWQRAQSSFLQAEAQVAQLEADLKTARLGARSDQIEAAEAEVEALGAALTRAQWDLDQKQQAAPAGGLIFDTLFREGEWVPSGRPIVSLLPPGNVKVRAFIPEQAFSKVQPGQRVSVHLDGLEKPLEGKVSFISPEAEFTPPVIYSRQSRGKLVFMIEIVFNEEISALLHPGQPVDVELHPH